MDSNLDGSLLLLLAKMAKWQIGTKRREKPTSQVESVHTDVIVGASEPHGQRHWVSQLSAIMHLNIRGSFSIKLVTFPQQTHQSSVQLKQLCG